MFSSSVENTAEYFRIVLLEVILKNLSPIEFTGFDAFK